jgi:nitroreductase
MDNNTPAHGHDLAIHDLLRRRRSGRAYAASRTLTDADVAALLEAARWAPSGGNNQPWRYVVGRRGEPAYDRLLDLLVPGNRSWAQHAPLLLLTAYHTHRQTSDGQFVLNATAQHDLGMANLSIALEAVNRGLMAHMMGGFNHEAARELIRAEAHRLDLGPMIAVGHAADLSHLSDELRARACPSTPCYCASSAAPNAALRQYDARRPKMTLLATLAQSFSPLKDRNFRIYISGQARRDHGRFRHRLRRHHGNRRDKRTCVHFLTRAQSSPRTMRQIRRDASWKTRKRLGR